MWNRDPFYGGCNYVSEFATVTGFYSPNNPLEFESDCLSWTATNLPGKTFTSAQAAMVAAEKESEL